MPAPPSLWPLWMFWAFDVARYGLTDLLVCAAELRQRLRPTPRPPLPAAPPLASVIIAGHNEARTLPLTLSSLMEQTYPRLEIIVVDDGSTDGTEGAVRRALSLLPGAAQIPCQVVRLPTRQGKAGALNLGLLLARGEFVVYVDADTTFDRDAIEEILRPMLADPEIGAVGGNLAVRNARHSLLTEVVALEYLFSIDVGRRFRSQVGLLHIISGAFGAFRRDLVEAVGGHTPTSGNDGDLTLKVRRLSRICFAPRAVCQTRSPATLSALARQRRRWDRNLIKNKLRRHLDLLDPRSAGFRASNAMLVLDAIFFNLVLGLRWVWVALLALLLTPRNVPGLMLVSYGLYLGGAAAQLSVAHWLRPPAPGARLWRWLCLPLYPIYKAAFRLVRLWAYGEEVFRQASYADSFAPRLVSLEALRYEHRGRLRMTALLRSLVWPFA